MNALDILLIALLAGVVALALRRVIRTRRSGGCGCGCDGCSGSCARRQPDRR